MNFVCGKCHEVIGEGTEFTEIICPKCYTSNVFANSIQEALDKSGKVYFHDAIFHVLPGFY